MAKTVKQLQAEFDKAAEEAQRTYDVLHPPFGNDSILLDKEYKKAVAAGDTKTVAKLKPAYDKALAAYTAAQNKKNALRKELETAKTAEEKTKTTAATNKAAGSVYSKAIKDLAVAEAAISGYKGKENYISAYQKAQQAFDNAQKAGVSVTVLPAPKIEIPVVTSDNKTGTGTGDTTTEKPLNEVIDFLADPNNKTILANVQKNLAKNFGYKGPTNGTWSLDFQKTLASVAGNRTVVPKAFQGASLLDFIAAPAVDLGMGSSGSGAGQTPPITDYPVVSSLTDAEKLINSTFQSALNRDATAAEIKLLYPLLKKAQLDNPTSYKKATVNGKSTQIQYSGLDAGQWLLDQISSNSKLKLKDELAKVATEEPSLLKREADKKIYDDLIAKAGNNPDAIAKIKSTTAYGRGIAELEASLKSSASVLGAINSEEELFSLAKNLYDNNLKPDSAAGKAQISKILKYGVDPTTGKFKGTAATTVADLQKTAAANGLDLTKNFGDKVNSWITAVNNGEDIDNIKQQIRDVAKLGQPDSIKKMIDNGIDLTTIYSPYKRTMASTLEIQDPNSISLDDPTLRMAITPNGEMNLYDFQKALRQDSRWQYTGTAKQEVSNAALKVLKDFGFQG